MTGLEGAIFLVRSRLDGSWADALRGSDADAGWGAEQV
jgi:hypothetical protein